MHKTIRAASSLLGAAALASFCAHANAGWAISDVSDPGFHGDGSVSGSFPTFVLTGSNNGDPSTSGFDSTTLYTATFTTSASITFNWQYATADSNPEYDTAGWILDNVETELFPGNGDNTTASGTTTLIVKANDTFGFYVHSIDSLGGAAMLAIGEDLPPPPPPPPPPAIPEPANAALMMAGLAALFAAARRRKNG
jgi:hypothetical protein